MMSVLLTVLFCREPGKNLQRQFIQFEVRRVRDAQKIKDYIIDFDARVVGFAGNDGPGSAAGTG
jgi:hypothetical protein